MITCLLPHRAFIEDRRIMHSIDTSIHRYSILYTLPARRFELARPKGTIVVVDWGGGGVEATVLKRTDGVLSVVGQAADPSVGGGVFTERLVAFCAKDFRRRTGGDIFESKRSVLKARYFYQ